MVSGAFISKYRRKLAAVGKRKKLLSKSLHSEQMKSAKSYPRAPNTRVIDENSMHKIINDINEISYIHKKKNFKRQDSPLIEEEANESSKESVSKGDGNEPGGAAYRRLNSILKKRNLSINEIQIPQNNALPAKFSEALKSAASLTKVGKSAIFRIKDSKVSFSGFKELDS